MAASIATIVGARPQFIKAAMVSRALRRQGLTEILIHTGQHYDSGMSDVFFSELEIPPPMEHLGVGSGSHGAQTARMLSACEEVLTRIKPTGVVVFGDTNSTLAGALAAAKLHIPVAHVEAGLRSFNRRMPEEINRVLTDHLADLLFAPTNVAVQHLKREGIPDERVEFVGDVMYDAALLFGSLAKTKVRILDDLGLIPKQFILATIHRAENTDALDRLRNIVTALAEAAREMSVVWPIHPRTKAVLQQLALPALEQIKTIPPVGYLDMVALESNAALIATDSGGVQKEAFFHRVPCVTLREETEWTELIELGWNRLSPPTCGDRIAADIRDALNTVGKPSDPYGDGRASNHIAESLHARLRLK